MRRLFLCALFALFGIGVHHAAVMNLGDPTVFCEGDTFYISGSWQEGSGFHVYSSTDLVHWTLCGKASSGGLALAAADVYGTSLFWAPHLFSYNGSYYMAYAADTNVAIAKSDSPMGPYTMENKECINGSTGKIDPYVFIDGDGKKYIYYVRFINGNSIYVAELNDDFATIDENTVTQCLMAGGGWERTGSEQIAEGPAVIKDNGIYYLTYSANHVESPNYAIGYAYSDSPMGPWTKMGSPILSRHNLGVNGPGHGEPFRGPDGSWYFAFHVHASNAGMYPRRTCIIPITLTDDPTNKFIPDTERMIILDTAASEDETFPVGTLVFEEDNIMYRVSDEEAAEVEVTFKDNIFFGGYEGYVTIPETVTHEGKTYTVVGVGTGAFYDSPDLKRLSLPTTIERIGYGGIEDCGNLWGLEIHAPQITIDYSGLLSSTLLDVVLDNDTPFTYNEDYIATETYTNGKLWVPEGTGSTYQTADG